MQTISLIAYLLAPSIMDQIRFFWLHGAELVKFDTIRLSDYTTRINMIRSPDTNITQLNGYGSLNLTRLLNEFDLDWHDFLFVGLGLKFLTHLFN